MQALYNSTFPILIQGETGTGKSRLAKEIHRYSKFSKSRFVLCNLAGLSEGIFESELFGHIKGAFTGAISEKSGFCEVASGGTLFLDEIGDTTLTQQKKLLQLLDTGEYYSVGSTTKKKFAGRFIFATHKDLEEQVRRGGFREDLFYRLGGVAIQLKPYRSKSLEEKRCDLDKILKDALERNNIKGKYLSEEVVRILINYKWPGNYREIKTALELLLLKTPRMRVEVKDLPLKFLLKVNSEGSFKQQVAEFERKILYTEVVNKGVGVNKASKSLGISKTTLIAKLRKYGISEHKLGSVQMKVA